MLVKPSLCHCIGKNDSTYWVGAIQVNDVNGTFGWVNGASFEESLWFTGEPNNNNGVNRACVTAGNQGQDLKMTDVQCSSSHPFICERCEFTQARLTLDNDSIVHNTSVLL